MCKSLMTITAAVAMLSAGALMSNRAEAGGSVSAPTKASRATVTAAVVQSGRRVRSSDFAITELSSSSARNHPPRR
jgi:hypothetical protein